MPVVWPGAWIFEAEKIGKIMPVDDVLRDRDDEDLRVDNPSPILRRSAQRQQKDDSGNCDSNTLTIDGSER